MTILINPPGLDPNRFSSPEKNIGAIPPTSEITEELNDNSMVQKETVIAALQKAALASNASFTDYELDSHVFIPGGSALPINYLENKKSPYVVLMGIEGTSPAGDKVTKLSRIAHAAGYLLHGLVTVAGVANDELKPEIDHARGQNVENFVARNQNDVNDISTLRRYSLRPGETWRDLPMYSFSSSGIFAEAVQEIEEYDKEEGSIKELCALATTNGISGLNEIIHTLIKDALIKNPKEVWVCSIVENAHGILTYFYGPRNVRPIGSAVRIEDASVEAHVNLIPSIIVLRDFLDNIVVDIADAKKEIENQTNQMTNITGPELKAAKISIIKAQRSIGNWDQSLRTLTEGLDPRLYSDNVKSYLSSGF